MINEERVKEITQIALYDQETGYTQDQVKKHFKSDFVGKEIVKSVFSGTFTFIIVAVMYGMYKSPELVDQINHIDFMQLGNIILKYYGVFMLVYLFFTFLVYNLRFDRERKKLDAYREHLDTLNKMYEREEKLRQ